jgi:hypothetical protein
LAGAVGQARVPGHEALPEQQWICFELEVSGTGTGAEMRVWWDGVEHTHLHLINGTEGEPMWPIPEYESMSFGFSHYQEYGAIFPQGFDVWIDEIAVDDERIGCQI